MNIAKIELWAFRSAAVLAGLFLLTWWIYAKGEAHTQAKWNDATAKAEQLTEEQNVTNRRLEANRQQRVLVAEATAGQATLDLANYRHTHPIRAVLTRGVHTADVCHPAETGAGAVGIETTGAGQTTGILQPPDARDIGGAIDDLMAQADSINNSYGICLSTRLEAKAQALPGQGS